MKKFAFSFQYLLDTHRSRAQAAEHALHDALHEQAGVQSVLDQKRADRECLKERLVQMVGIVKRSDFAAHHRSIDFVQREMDGLAVELRRCAEKVESLRSLFRKEMMGQRIMENLCDRERVEWANAVQKEEQKLMDEMAVVRWNRQEKVV